MADFALTWLAIAESAGLQVPALGNSHSSHARTQLRRRAIVAEFRNYIRIRLPMHLEPNPLLPGWS